jgi:hypothetical protein
MKMEKNFAEQNIMKENYCGKKTGMRRAMRFTFR